MSSSNWKPWWMKVGDIPDPNEQKEFMRGVGGAQKPTYGSQVLLSLIAGYIGGKVAERTGRDK